MRSVAVSKELATVPGQKKSRFSGFILADVVVITLVILLIRAAIFRYTWNTFIPNYMLSKEGKGNVAEISLLWAALASVLFEIIF